MARALRVHVCIDQEIGDAPASGLVGTWLRLLEEAVRHADLDVTAHFIGPSARVRPLSRNVRIREHPVPSTVARRLEHEGGRMPGHPGLAPYDAELARALRGAEVIHTTYTHFRFAMTALVAARLRGVPLVNSIHTDVPRYAEIYAGRFAASALGRGLLGALVRPARVGAAVRRLLERQERWYLSRCSYVLISAPDDARAVPRDYPRDRVIPLGRGLDRARFHPGRRDRRMLAERFGIGPTMPVVLFVGRLMPEKAPLLLARALARLAPDGPPFRLLACGAGPERDAIAEALGPRAVFAGVEPRATIPAIYASADILGFPSPTECYANVVVEAMASGLPPVVSARGGSSQHIDRPGEDGIVVAADDPPTWAEALGALLRDADRRRRMGAAARARIEAAYPGWSEIFERVVKRCWLAAAEGALRPASGADGRPAAARDPGRARPAPRPAPPAGAAG